MIEPTYHYIKGQGWVPGGCESFEAITYTKRKMRVELRRPNLGEKFLVVNQWNGFVDGVLNQERVKQYIGRQYSDYFSKWRKLDATYFKEDDPEERIITIIPMQTRKR